MWAQAIFVRIRLQRTKSEAESDKTLPCCNAIIATLRPGFRLQDKRGAI